MKEISMAEGCPISGQLFYVVKRKGEIVEEFRERNMIMYLGRVGIARLFMAISGGAVQKVGVGRSADTPSPDQTGLDGQYLVDAAKIRYAKAVVVGDETAWEPSDEPTPQVRIDFNFGPEDANGLSIREFGLFSEDGTMFARRIRGSGKGIDKDEDLTIEGYWVIIF